MLDAENEQSLTFFCYARDMAEVESERKQSSMVEFTISILDVNEFEPVIMTDMHLFMIHENDKKIVAPAVLGSIACYDHDIGSELKLMLNSIRYAEFIIYINVQIKKNLHKTSKKQRKALSKTLLIFSYFLNSHKLFYRIYVGTVA